MSLPLRVWSGSEWIDIGVQGGTVLYQNEQPASPETGMIWIDADSETSVVDADTFLTQSTASATYATKNELTQVEALALLGL